MVHFSGHAGSIPNANRCRSIKIRFQALIQNLAQSTLGSIPEVWSLLIGIDGSKGPSPVVHGILHLWSVEWFWNKLLLIDRHWGLIWHVLIFNVFFFQVVGVLAVAKAPQCRGSSYMSLLIKLRFFTFFYSSYKHSFIKHLSPKHCEMSTFEGTNGLGCSV